MSAKRLALAAALSGLSIAAIATADNGAPSFTSDSLVNAATGQAGFAPYTICSLYGTDLFLAGDAGATGGNEIPDALAGVIVLIGMTPAGVFYVSPNQINLLIPNSLAPANYTLRVVRNGVSSPSVPFVIQEVAPGLFASSPGFAAATHADGSPITANAPAAPGEVVILYGTGFGRTQPDQTDRSIAPSAATIVHSADFELLLDGVALDPSMVLYVGVAPFNAGLYQVNVQLPNDLAPTNPQVQVTVAGISSPAGVSLITAPAPGP